MIQSQNLRDNAPHRVFSAGQRWIGRESSINLCLLVFVAVCFLSPSCKGETMVSGKPVSHWVAILEDRDKREWFKAFDALRWCNKDDLKGARTRLRQMAVGGNIFSRNAALLLFDKFQEVDAKFTDAYLVTNGDETYVRGGAAIKALAGTGLEGSLAALAAVRKKLSTIDGTEKWSSAMSQLTREVIAVSNAKQ
jgi:hypothetical protein